MRQQKVQLLLALLEVQLRRVRLRDMAVPMSAARPQVRESKIGTPRALAPPNTPPAKHASTLQPGKPNMPVLLAGGEQGTLLSEAGPALLPFFTTRDACALRLVCQEFLAAVRAQPWEDRGTVIKGSIAAWRACFPRARCANVARCSRTRGEVRRADVVDADFVHFEGLRELNMLYCLSVTDAAFVHLRSIHSLEISRCLFLTDAALVHIAGVQRLGMARCRCITDAAFVHLRGIQLLNMRGCTQLTDAAFVHLRGITTLFMGSCSQPAVTDAAFVHLRGIRTLVMDYCTQATITGATFSSLVGIEDMCMRACNEGVIAAACALELPSPPFGLWSLGGQSFALFPWRKQRAGPWRV